MRNFRLAKVAASELTRPADTTAYAALDAISNSTTSPTALTFTGLAGGLGGGAKIIAAKILTDQSTNTSQFRLHLFTTSPTAINDNSPYTHLYANKASWIGAITFVAATTEGTGSNTASSVSTGLNLPFVAASTGKHLYGLLESVGGFTPAPAQKFYIELTAETEY